MEKDPKGKKGKKDKQAKGEPVEEPVEEGMEEKAAEVSTALPVGFSLPKKDPRYPVKVPICPACKMTQELCEYSPKPTKCLDYYEKHNKEIFEALKIRVEAIAKKKGPAKEEAVAPVEEGKEGENEEGEEGEKTDSKTDKTAATTAEGDASKAKKNEVPETKKKPNKAPAKFATITVTKKRAKYITDVAGLDKFDINEKTFSGTLGKKFATGASYTKGTGIMMQGDLGEELMDYILESFADKITEDDIKIERKEKKEPTE